MFACVRFQGELDPHKLLEDPVVGQIAKKYQLSPAQVGEMRSACVALVRSCSGVLDHTGLDVLLGVAEVPHAAGRFRHTEERQTSPHSSELKGKTSCTLLCVRDAWTGHENWDVSSQIFNFSLTWEDMEALKGLDRKWKACLLDE